MITFKEAELVAKQHLIEMQEIPGSLQITEIQEKSFGWVFFYQSKGYLDTGDFSSILVGNAPFIVDRRQGAIHVLGTAEPVDVYIQDFLLKNSDAL